MGRKSRIIMSASLNSWDLVALSLIAVTLVYLEIFPSPHVRRVDLRDPSVNFPHIPSIVSTRLLVMTAFLLPPVVVLAAQSYKIRKSRPVLVIFTFMLLESNTLTGVITNVFKLLAGRPRPHFSTVCEKYSPDAENVCTGVAEAVKEARKSFPSGHSSLAFSAATILFLYLVLRFRLADENVSAKSAKMLITLLPLATAGFVAVSRTIDFHHHFSDIVAGTALGAIVAGIVFWTRRKALIKAMDMDSAPLEGPYLPMTVEDADE